MTNLLQVESWEYLALYEGELDLLLRPVEPQPHPSCSPQGCGWHWHGDGGTSYAWASLPTGLYPTMVDRCPYGKSGDTLGFRWSNEWNEILERRIASVDVVKPDTLGTEQLYSMSPPDIGCSKASECRSSRWPGVGAFSDELSQSCGGRPWQECHCVEEVLERLYDQAYGLKAWSGWAWAIKLER